MDSSYTWFWRMHLVEWNKGEKLKRKQKLHWRHSSKQFRKLFRLVWTNRVIVLKSSWRDMEMNKMNIYQRIYVFNNLGQCKLMHSVYGYFVLKPVHSFSSLPCLWFVFIYLQRFPHLVLIKTFDVFCRSMVGGKCYTSSTSHGSKEKLSEEAIITHTKLVSPGSLENPDVGKICYSVWSASCTYWLLTLSQILGPSSVVSF